MVGGAASAEPVTWRSSPASHQWIPRDPASNSGIVVFEGDVRAADVDRVRLRVNRDGLTRWLTSMPLEGDLGGGFRLADRLPAGPYRYDLDLELAAGERFLRVMRIRDVMVGDAILVNGGSNAGGERVAGTAAANRHPLIRTFGRDESDALAGHGRWWLAVGDAAGGETAVGQWALRMARQLVDDYGRPLAVLNGAGGDESIDAFLPDPADPANPQTNYGRLLTRARHAGAADHARLMVWWQGDWEQGDLDAYDRAFATLRGAWMRDYPALERIYVIQTRPGFEQDRWQAGVRERQRRWGTVFANVTVHSTTGLRSHDGRRYAYTRGYADLGSQLARLWGRDGFHDPRERVVEAPQPVRAYLTKRAGGELMVEMQSADQRLRWDPGAEADFRLEPADVRIIRGDVDGHRLRLALDGSGLTATGVTYAGHSGAGPRVTNPAGIGLVSFEGFPIDPPLPPARPPLAVSRVVSCIQIDLTWEPVVGATGYRVERDGVEVGRPAAPRFSDLPLSPATRYRYRVAAVNRGGSTRYGPLRSARTEPVPGPPRAPEGVAARALSNCEIEIHWSPAMNAVAYVVERNGQILNQVFATNAFRDLSLTSGAEYVYRVAGCHPQATSSFSRAVSMVLTHQNVFARVEEAAGYVIVYDLDLPVDLSLDDRGRVIYDRVTPFHDEFDRVAYYLELRRGPFAPMDWVYVSMDAFTRRIEAVGVPTVAVGAAFQQAVSNVWIASSSENLPSGPAPRGALLESWGRTYSTGNAAGIPGADATRYDAGDEMNLAGVYGSMQVHLPGDPPRTVFAYNGWAAAGPDDVGIGPGPSRHPDWTFEANAGAFTHRRLQVLVRPAGAVSGRSLPP